MAGPPAPSVLKRKAPADIQQPKNARKRQKNHDDRSIRTQSADAALSNAKELNVAAYIKAREFEIKALEQSMAKARKRLTQRAFQQVPRHMRRRTASHNVKKVPRRLRKRARREMKEDNTPTVTKRTRTPSRKLRIRTETAKALKKLNQKRKTARQKKKDAQENSERTDPQDHVLISRVPRLKKNTLAKPPTATSKYKKRQVSKTWLPTHMWHTKRAHMTQPTTPLWRMTIPLSPTEKSYRPSHRAAGNRGCIAWDTSFMSTIACIGTDETLEKFLRALGFHGENWAGTKHAFWRKGTRFAEGWIYERDNKRSPICPAIILWIVQAETSAAAANPSTSTDSTEPSISIDVTMQDTSDQSIGRKRKKLDRQIFIRFHPSGFHQLWPEVLKVAKMQKPQVLVEDLRFEVGSVEVVGSGATESLIGVLRPDSAAAQPATDPASIWKSLTEINNAALLPRNSLLAFNIVDPRLNHPPKTVRRSKDQERSSALNELLVSWPVDQSLKHSKLASHKIRWLASHGLPSQKAINRRRALSRPGQPLDQTDRDHEIPIIVLAHRSATVSANAQGKWIVMLPWGCVDAVWRSLMYYPLSSGGTPRFGGLQEEQQIAFEQARPWFPADYPGTEAGKAWDRTQNEKRFDEWIRKPPSRRLAWDAVDLGLGRKGEIGQGWACDWELLLQSGMAKTALQKNQALAINGPSPASQTFATQEPSLTQRQRKAVKARAAAEAELARRRRNTSSPETDDEQETQPEQIRGVEYDQLLPAMVSPLIKAYRTSTLPSTPALITVRITLLNRGTPNATARIYRLPTVQNTTPSNAQPTQEPPNQHPTQQSPSEPPPGAQIQPQSSTPSNPSSPHSPDCPQTLRKKWLALDPQQPPKSLPKIKPNHNSLPKVSYSLPRESLDHIIALPPNAHAETVRLHTLPPRPRNDTSIYTHEEIIQYARDKDLWKNGGKECIPCPNETDLIGYVTSGGYNLSQGRGTGVGALWLQRVVAGWRDEDEDEDVGMVVGTEKDRSGKGKAIEKKRERERRLCIVRNSGESVGRLSIWEICE